MSTSSELSSRIGFDLEAFFNECRTSIDGALDDLLPAESVEPISVHQAIRWSVFAGANAFAQSCCLLPARCSERLVRNS